MTSRRTFLALSASTLAVAALPKMALADRLGGAVFSNGSLGAYDQGLMTQANFERVIGTEFKVFTEDNGVSYLRLRKVSTNESASTASKITRAASTLGKPGTASVLRPNVELVTFQLHLALVRGPQFTQDTYLTDHATMGRFAAFLVPCREDVYLATFCSLAQASKLPGQTPRVAGLAAS